MEGPSEDINSALESFREQWRAEVRSKQPVPGQHPGRGHAGSSAPAAVSGAPSESKPPAAGSSPPSALALYEEAVEMEARGKLGESLTLYRTAFRMDDNVDRLYRAKHFPHARPPKPAPSGSAPSASPSQPASQHSQAALPTPTPATAASGAAPQEPAADVPRPRVSLDDLVSGFAGLAIEPAPPEVEGMPPPPCPIAALPDEVLMHILLDVAVDDVGDFVRLAQVCRRLAFLVATEERIWRRVCLGTEFGFAGMHRLWNTDLTWGPPLPVLDEAGGGEAEGSASEAELGHRRADGWHDAAGSLLLRSPLESTYKGSWQTMFRHRPRIRFNGCYISTVNYIRAGQASANLVTWNSPVHVCTYFRYLRFFRDGTCISLLTTTEPAEVVPYLTKQDLELHRGTPVLSLPSSVMQHALKGRWRLGSAAQAAGSATTDAAGGPADDQPVPSEADLFVETEGVGKYIYRLDLAFKTAGKGAKNNKLAWKGFWSYNRLTDDWAEFGLKNDKAFVFSRVKRFAAS